MKREWFAELWRYRELCWFLAWRDVKVRYSQAALGAGWAIIQPLLSMIVFTLFFGRVTAIARNDVPYPVFVYCALLPWTYFSGTLGQAGNSLTGNMSLITKVYFPRVLLPASSALSGLLDFLICSVFLVVLMAYYRIQPSWALSFYPILIVAMWMLTVGVSIWLAALNVRYRDVKHVIPFLTQIGLFVTPIIYPKTLVPHHLQPLLALNPMAGLVEGFRACVFPQRETDFTLIGSSAVITALVFIASATYFRKMERTFADIV